MLDHGRRLLRRGAAVLGVLVASFLGAPTAGAQVAPCEGRCFLSVNFGYQVGDRAFAESTSADIYEETATYGVTHASSGGGFFDVRGGVRVWSHLAAGLGVTTFSTRGGAAVTGSVPHPLFFNRPRTATFNFTDLEHKQTGVHFQAVWVMPITDVIEVSVFGGPSVFMVDQGIVTGATPTEIAAPFNVVEIASAAIGAVSETAVGGNVGVDVTYLVTEQLGAGIFARWAGASVDIPATGGSQRIDVGGAQFGIGVRARF